MCGIAGWVDWRRDLRAQAAVVEAMTATMRCRGPDAVGTWLSREAAFGHRRLAVIDIVGGAQPMLAPGDRDEDPAAVLTYSGEIYNFTELRAQLRGRGHHFATSSDTEVVLRSYLEWGPECVTRFNGIFGFAIWDGVRRQLLLARDPLGVKPLYYAPYQDGVVFGSEPKALLANPLVEAEIDEEGIGLLFAMFGTHAPGRSPLRGILEVKPGSTVLLTPTQTRHSQYWSLAGRRHEDDEARTVERVRELLADSVRRQLVADVPICSLVSGGLDSSVITALAVGGSAGDSIRTFSVDFVGSDRDFVATDVRPDLDGPYVKELVGHLGTRHSDVVLGTPDLLQAQQDATRARDLPSLGDLDASLHLLFAAIQGRSTVALSGESADEVFGGYQWFHDPRAVGRDMFPWAPPGAGFGEVLAPSLQRTVRPAEFLADHYRSALAEVPRVEGETTDQRRRREISYLALTRFLPVLLDRKDRMSMAVGLEVRVPFCDYRLVDYVWNVPWELKCLDGVPKGLLRRAAADLLPPSLLARRKSIFPAPANPDYDLTLRSAARALLKGAAPVVALLDPERILAIVDGTTAKPVWQQRMALAYLLQIDYWLRAYGVRILAAG